MIRFERVEIGEGGNFSEEKFSSLPKPHLSLSKDF